MEIEDILELTSSIDEIKPVVHAVINAVKSFGPESYDLLLGLAIGSVDIRTACVKRFEENGFTRQQAIDMTMDQWYQFSKSMNSANKKK